MKWEHKTEAVTPDKLNGTLDAAGTDGWQLAAMLQGAVTASPLATQATPGFLLVFKRPARVTLTDDQVANRLTGALTNGDGGG